MVEFHDGNAGPAQRLAALVRARHDEILCRWQERARALPGARGLPEPLLRDEVGELLRELADHLDVFDAGGSDLDRRRPEAGAAASHGVERLRAGFDIEEVVAEYNLLRTLLLEIATPEIQLPPPLVSFVNDVIDRSVGVAVKTYARQHFLEERRRRSEHIAFVTHEMRNPLATISAAADRLRIGGESAPDGIVAMLDNAIHRLDGLIRQLIEESRRIGGDLLRGSHPEVIKLKPLVDAVIVDLREPAGQAGIALRGEIPEGLEVRADVNMLDIVLANLVKNAIDHSGARHVVVGAERRQDSVACWVEDDGCGLAPEHLPSIFEPYQSRDPDAGGSGLGLYIAKRFMDALGGDITVHTRSAGVRFELTLPIGSRT